MPDKRANEFLEEITALQVISEKIRSLSPKADISEIEEGIEKLLDESIESEGYKISSLASIDLSEVDFEKLKERFAKKQKNIVNEAIKGKVESKLKSMIEKNPTRKKFLEKFQELLAEYNSGTMNAEMFLDKLIAFSQSLNEEEKRGIGEKLSEEELALFDILQKDELTEKERKEVKAASQSLLKNLKWAKLVLDWRSNSQTRSKVLVTIEDTLDNCLPRSYAPELFEEKCDAVYQHVYVSYTGSGKSIYEKEKALA